ncbi:unnamed protein product [Prorocentrum cordatum]|nr:unnamed protein product [Polarella glacialis]
MGRSSAIGPVDLRHAQTWLHSRLRDLNEDDFEGGLRIFCTSNLVPLEAFQDVWHVISRDSDIREGTPLLSGEDSAQLHTILVFCNQNSCNEVKRLCDIITNIDTGSQDAPPMFWVPHSAAPGPQRQGLDGIVCGEPAGLRLSMAVRSMIRKSPSLSRNLTEMVAETRSRTQCAEYLQHCAHATLCDYVRARLAPEIPPVDHNLEPGEPQELPGYIIGNKLGQGMFGSVYKLTERPGVGNRVQVVKVVSIEAITEIITLMYLNRMIRVMQMLSDEKTRHPNSIRLHQTYHSPTHIIFRLEYGGPENLYRRLHHRQALQPEKQRPLSIDRVVKIASQCAEAVWHLHAVVQVCHRDIKPENTHHFGYVVVPKVKAPLTEMLCDEGVFKVVAVGLDTQIIEIGVLAKTFKGSMNSDEWDKQELPGALPIHTHGEQGGTYLDKPPQNTNMLSMGTFNQGEDENDTTPGINGVVYVLYRVICVLINLMDLSSYSLQKMITYTLKVTGTMRQNMYSGLVQLSSFGQPTTNYPENISFSWDNFEVTSIMSDNKSISFSWDGSGVHSNTNNSEDNRLSWESSMDISNMNDTTDNSFSWDGSEAISNMSNLEDNRLSWESSRDISNMNDTKGNSFSWDGSEAISNTSSSDDNNFSWDGSEAISNTSSTEDIGFSGMGSAVQSPGSTWLKMNNEMEKKLASDPKTFNQVSKQFHNDKEEAKTLLEQWQARQTGREDEPPKNKRKKADPQASPRPAKGDKLHEDGVRLRDVWNVSILSTPPTPTTNGVYLARTDSEAIALLGNLDGVDLNCANYILITTATPSTTLKAAASAYEINPTPIQIPSLKTIKKEGKQKEVAQTREGWVWTLAAVDDTEPPKLEMATAAPQAPGWTTQFTNMIAVVSEYHGETSFKKLCKHQKAATEAFGKLKSSDAPKEDKKQLWNAVREANQETRSHLQARLQQLKSGKATNEELDITINSIKQYEGEIKTARTLRVDITTRGAVRDFLRRHSGKDGLFTDTCGYDDAGKMKDRQDETWLPLAAKTPGYYTVDEGREELDNIVGDTFGLRLNRDGAAGKDSDFLGGKPLPIQQIRPNTSTTLDNSSVHGGVGFLKHKSLSAQACAAKTIEARRVFERCRIHQVAVPLQTSGVARFFMHIITFYNDAGHRPAARVRKERMMNDVFTNGTTCGAQSTIICCDTNLTDQNIVIRDAVATGRRVDIGKIFSSPAGPEPTYGGKQDWGKPLDLVRWVPKMPTAFPVEQVSSLDEDQHEYLLDRTFQRRESHLKETRDLNNPTRMLEVATLIAEDYLEERCSTADPNFQGTRGRCRELTLAQEPLACRAASESKPQDPWTYRTARLYKNLRRVRERIIKYTIHPAPTTEIWKALMNRLANIVDDFTRMRLTTYFFDVAVPDLRQCQALQKMIEDQIDQYDRHGLETRLQAWRARLFAATTTTVSKADRAALKNHMRPPRDEPITAIRHYAIRPDDVLNELRKTWDPIFNKSDPSITWDKFHAKYHHLIQEKPCKLAEFDPDDYHEAIQ